MNLRKKEKSAGKLMTCDYMSDRQLAARYSIDKSTLWRWVKEGTFPSPIRLGLACTRWSVADLEAWEADKAEQSQLPAKLKEFT